MKGFIRKVSMGSQAVLIFEIALLIQVVLLVFLIYRNNNIDLDNYCPKHGYDYHSSPVSVIGS